jgi:hypothetical protein
MSGPSLTAKRTDLRVLRKEENSLLGADRRLHPLLSGILRVNGILRQLRRSPTDC